MPKKKKRKICEKGGIQKEYRKFSQRKRESR